MSNLIMESHLQAYENLSQVLIPYEAMDNKKKMSTNWFKTLLIRNDSHICHLIHCGT